MKDMNPDTIKLLAWLRLSRADKQTTAEFASVDLGVGALLLIAYQLSRIADALDKPEET